jgi:triacylglycerol esterase/lipase EstA (alpha/beta hydrolase family)
VRGRAGRAAVAAVVAALMLCGTTGAAGAQSLPAPGIPPPGANDPGCRPAAAHPDPVVLVHGTFGDMTASWDLISPVLRGLGYCVFALDYGHRGTDPVERSAAELGAFVDRVLATTRASHVLLVGHSQGGMMPRYWMRFLGGAAKVRGLVGLAPSNHGTTVAAAPAAGRGGCAACADQVAGSPFLTRLNAGGDTLPGIDYTVVETRYDEVVTPYTSAFLAGPGVTNVTIQDACPLDPVEHVGIIYDAVALQWVVDALDHAGLADPGFRPVC